MRSLLGLVAFVALVTACGMPPEPAPPPGASSTTSVPRMVADTPPRPVLPLSSSTSLTTAPEDAPTITPTLVTDAPDPPSEAIEPSPLRCDVSTGIGFPRFRPRTEVPWDEVASPGWILFDYFAVQEEPEAAPRALFLMSPTGDIFGLGTFEDPFETLMTDWHRSGREVVTVTAPEGRSMRPVGLLDLVDCSYQTIGRYPGAYTARFAGADAELVLIETQQVYDQTESYGLELVDRSGEVLRTLAEGMHPTEWRDPEAAGAFTWQVAADGAAVVIGSPAGLMAYRLDTATTEDLDAPGHACLVSRGLAGAALVSCVPERYPATCWEMWGGDGARGLWSVPLSGEAAVPVWVPDVEVPGEPDEECWIGAFIDMLPASANGPALLESTGCCECGGALALVDDGRVTPVLPEGCSPRLVAQWHDAWVVVDQVVTDGWNMALIELDQTGDLRRFLTPTMDGYGGVFHVLAAADR